MTQNPTLSEREALARRRVRIRVGVRPYPGKWLIVTGEDQNSVRGFVEVSRAKIATAERTYLRSEIVDTPVAPAEPVATVSFPREMNDDMAEVIALTAGVCGGIAHSIWEELVKIATPAQPSTVTASAVTCSKCGGADLMVCDCGLSAAPPAPSPVTGDWETVAEERGKIAADLGARLTVAQMAIENAVDVLGNRGRFGSPDDVWGNLKDTLDIIRAANTPTPSPTDTVTGALVEAMTEVAASLDASAAEERRAAKAPSAGGTGDAAATMAFIFGAVAYESAAKRIRAALAAQKAEG